MTRRYIGAHKYVLAESELPQAWYNLNPDLPSEPEPLLDPQTGEPMAPEAALTIMPQRILEEAASMQRWVDIPERVQDAYRTWRATPLFRARRLEQALDTPAHLYYKYEGVSPVGSHKLNTAMAQAYGAKQEGLRGLATETGAGQWGSAMAPRPWPVRDQAAIEGSGVPCHRRNPATSTLSDIRGRS